MKLILGMMLTTCCATSIAADSKPQAATCDAFASAFDGGMKQMAFIEASGVGDDSAARESNRLLEKVIETNVMQMNLNLMQINRCPMPKQPVTEALYALEAMRCSNAIMKAQLAGDKSAPPECDRSKWKKITDEK